jgi:hypothetical protein
MLYGIHVVELPLIPKGASSPDSFPDYLNSDDECSEWKEDN